MANNQTRSSLDGSVNLVMQGDNNFCLYRAGTPVWCSNTAHEGQGLATAMMQTDGNLCINDAQGTPLSCSNTAGNPGAYLIVHDEGYIAIYLGTRMLWRMP